MMRRNLFALLMIGLMMVPGGVGEGSTEDFPAQNKDSPTKESNATSDGPTPENTSQRAAYECPTFLGQLCEDRCIGSILCTCKQAGYGESPVAPDLDPNHPSVKIGLPAKGSAIGGSYGPYWTFDSGGCA
jgi:hypothetical protein